MGALMVVGLHMVVTLGVVAVHHRAVQGNHHLQLQALVGQC